MDEKIWEFLNPLILKRLDTKLVDNENYKKLIAKETLCYKELKKSLEKTQQEQLEVLFNATTETSIFCQELAYKQALDRYIGAYRQTSI